MHRTVRQAIHELSHPLRAFGRDRLRRAVADDVAVSDDINVVGDACRLAHVVGDDDAGQPAGVIQLPDQRYQHTHGDRVLAGERLVVHDHHRVQRHRAGQRDATGHAAGELARHQPRRAAQPDRFELHQHEFAQQRFRQPGMFPQREGDVLVDVQVGQQGAALK